MNKTVIAVVIILLINCTAIAGQRLDKSVSHNRMAKDLMAAVMREDMRYLMKYVSPSGTYFIDERYSREEISNSMGDSNGWLHKHLFSGDKSVKSYFSKAENLKINIKKRNSRSILITYKSSNYNSVDWVECCLFKVKGKWYFDGIFYCG